MEEVGGSIKEEHLVSSFTPTLNISNLIIIRLVSHKHCIRPNGDSRTTLGTRGGIVVVLFELVDFLAPIFKEDNKEVVLEYF